MCTAPNKGRRIGRRLGKCIDVISIPKNIDNLDFAFNQLNRATLLFGLDGYRIERMAFTMILRIKGRKDAVVDDENWEAVCNFLTTPGMSFTSARLIMALGPVVKLTAAQRFGGLLLEAKRKLVGWSLPLNLA